MVCVFKCVYNIEHAIILSIIHIEHFVNAYIILIDSGI